MKRIGYLSSVLAVLILVGIQLSPAWTPFFEKDGQKIEICTLQGIKTIIFDADGLPVEQEKDHQPIEHCPLCMLRTAALLSPQALTIPAPLGSLEKAYLPHKRDTIVFTKNRHLFRPRDPPHISA